MTTYRDYYILFLILFALFSVGIALDNQLVLNGASTALTGAGLGVLGGAIWKALKR